MVYLFADYFREHILNQSFQAKQKFEIDRWYDFFREFL